MLHRHEQRLPVPMNLQSTTF